ncbi:MAG: helix-turn-helix transcriptional regulator [Candidatus Levybacteria bacterium]|nr:helix-turn-helix transcriptional regulator [Candidatus Levybacteria bacterium]
MNRSDAVAKENLNELAKRIRTARQEARLSQSALGKSIGVSDKSVSSYEQGRSTPPFAKLRKIAEATERPISYFTQENTDDANIASKLISIERELNEVKKLLQKAKK